MKIAIAHYPQHASVRVICHNPGLIKTHIHLRTLYSVLTLLLIPIAINIILNDLWNLFLCFYSHINSFMQQIQIHTKLTEKGNLLIKCQNA